MNLRSRTFLPSCLLVLAGLLVATPAQGTTPRPLVVDLTTLTQKPRAEAIHKLISEKTPWLPGTYPLISGANPEFLDLFRWLYPSDPNIVCPPDMKEFDDILARARGLIVELELDRALAALEQAYRTLPCRVEPISRESLHKVFYFEGIIYRYLGQSDASTQAFLAALAIDASQTPVPGFPPDIGDAYRNAANLLPSLTPVKFDIDLAFRQDGLLIDGQPLPEVAEDITLLPGPHLAQVVNAQGLARTVIFEVEKGESRPLRILIDIMPSGSASYLNALLRTSLQSGYLTSAQRRTLDVLARLRDHSMILFAIVSSGAPGGMKLLTYIPEKDLIEGAPSGLTPLPPMEEPVAARPKRPPRRGFLRRFKEARANRPERRPQRPEKEEPPPRQVRVGPRQPFAGRPTQRPPRQEPPPPPSRNSTGLLTCRLEMGPVGYQGDVFTNLLPSLSVRLWTGLHVQVALFYGNDLGTHTGTMLNLVGLRIGPEYELKLGPILARAGLGTGLTAARVAVLENGASELVLEGIPEAWSGIDYPLSQGLRLGLAVGGGFSPGLTAGTDSRSLWRVGLSAGWTLR